VTSGGWELLIDRRGPLLRAAVVSGGRLADLHIDREDRREPQAGSLWLGRVERIAAGLNAAFVDLGTGKAGLLGLSDVRLPGGRRPESGAAIGTLVRCGQGVLVQVKAEAVGAKGPTLAMDISLPGRFLVHVPFRRGVTVSRRLGEGVVRAALTRRLQALTCGDGWIARSGCETVTDDGLLAAEAEALVLAWRDLERTAARTNPPLPLSPGPDAGRRAAIGHGSRPLDRLVIETRDDAGRRWADGFAAWCADAAPDLEAQLERHSGPGPLFEQHDLDGQIAALARPHVALSGGAGLVIERTEALTAIDVNAGERGNPLAVNLEAAAEIARQLRLRNIGGIVVADFVSMPRRGDGEKLLDVLAAAVRDDPVQTEVYGLSKLGLIEMTRARRGPMLADLLPHARETLP